MNRLPKIVAAGVCGCIALAPGKVCSQGTTQANTETSATKGKAEAPAKNRSARIDIRLSHRYLDSVWVPITRAWGIHAGPTLLTRA